jgi:hypothetical protein
MHSPTVAGRKMRLVSSGEAVTQESLGLRPISANLRVLGLYAEGLSRRDSVKVAQYEVLGNDAKRPSLKTLTQHFVLGYFRQVPAGPISLTTNSDPDRDFLS